MCTCPCIPLCLRSPITDEGMVMMVEMYGVSWMPTSLIKGYWKADSTDRHVSDMLAIHHSAVHRSPTQSKRCIAMYSIGVPPISFVLQLYSIGLPIELALYSTCPPPNQLCIAMYSIGIPTDLAL